MSTNVKPHPPAKTAAERQAARRARVALALDKAKVDAYQVRSFNELWKQCMIESMQLTLTAHDLDPSDPLESLNELLKRELIETRRVNKAMREGKSLKRPQRVTNATAPAKRDVTAPGKPRKPRVGPATVTPSRGKAKRRSSRERVKA